MEKIGNLILELYDEFKDDEAAMNALNAIDGAARDKDIVDGLKELKGVAQSQDKKEAVEKIEKCLKEFE